MQTLSRQFPSTALGLEDYVEHGHIVGEPQFALHPFVVPQLDCLDELMMVGLSLWLNRLQFPTVYLLIG
jgi:hypothetical protein